MLVVKRMSWPNLSDLLTGDENASVGLVGAPLAAGSVTPELAARLLTRWPIEAWLQACREWRDEVLPAGAAGLAFPRDAVELAALCRDTEVTHGPQWPALLAVVWAAADEDGLTTADAGCFSVTPRGRPFVRAIAARFDTYLNQGAARHSLAI